MKGKKISAYSPEAGTELIGMPPGLTPQPLFSAQPVRNNAVVVISKTEARRPGNDFMIWTLRRGRGEGVTATAGLEGWNDGVKIEAGMSVAAAEPRTPNSERRTPIARLRRPNPALYSSALQTSRVARRIASTASPISASVTQYGSINTITSRIGRVSS